MRPLLLILILAVVAAIALLATGLVDIDTVRGARAPNVTATGNGIVASGGQAPAFDVQTGSVGVGKGQATVPVPTLKVNRADANDVAPTTTVVANTVVANTTQ